MNPTTTTAPPPGTPRSAQYDAFHTARARTDVVARLYGAAMGEDHPYELDASSSCDWPLLGLLTARLRMRPGRLLVDAGCGSGGVGLWLARALALRLEGFDLSPLAVALATNRRAHFLRGDVDRAAFRVADLEDTGLPDSAAHGIVCVDALAHARDREAAVRELGRVLAPGGRLVTTRSLRGGTHGAWDAQARAAGLVLEHVDERPAEPAMWDRLYRLWIAHADDLRRTLGEIQAQRMLGEARRVLPTLPGRRAVLVTLLRPDTTGAADRMPGPTRTPGDRATTGEGTPQ